MQENAKKNKFYEHIEYDRGSSFTMTSPIFIVGVDRSGTTLLNMMLHTHSKIAMPYESKFFVRYYLNRDAFGDLSQPEARQNLIRTILNEPSVKAWDVQLREKDIDSCSCNTVENTINTVYSAYAESKGALRWGDKTPAYVENLHILNAMFPECSFIHLVRDGRDVANSIIPQWWGPDDFTTAIRTWEKRVSCARKMLAMLPSHRFIELRFEDLVGDPSRELKKICQFLNISYEKDMLIAYGHNADNMVGSRIDSIHKNLKSRPMVAHTYKWKKNLSPADQAIAYEIAGRTLSQLGYDDGIKHCSWKLLGEIKNRIKGSMAWRLKKRGVHNYPMTLNQ